MLKFPLSYQQALPHDLFIVTQNSSKFYCVIRASLFTVHSTKVPEMGLFARAMAISFGILAGGAVGFYYRETYHAAAVENKCDKAEARLRELVRIRKSKEKRLEELKAKSA